MNNSNDNYNENANNNGNNNDKNKNFPTINTHSKNKEDNKKSCCLIDFAESYIFLNLFEDNNNLNDNNIKDDNKNDNNKNIDNKNDDSINDNNKNDDVNVNDDYKVNIFNNNDYNENDNGVNGNDVNDGNNENENNENMNNNNENNENLNIKIENNENMDNKNENLNIKIENNENMDSKNGNLNIKIENNENIDNKNNKNENNENFINYVNYMNYVNNMNNGEDIYNQPGKEVNIDHLTNLLNSYKAGIFEEVINGPRGPDIRLHRHVISVGFLKLFLCLFATAGIVLLSVIILCITINVGYVCVQIDDINSLVQMIFFVYYTNALYIITRSVWRTYIRLIHTIMRARFGATVNDIFIKRVLGYYLSSRIALMTLPRRYRSHPKDWYEIINTIMFVVFIFILLLPFPLIAAFCGYWMITSIMCLVFVIGGALTILVLNFFSKIVLFTKFFRRLDDFYYNAPSFIDIDERIANQTQYLRVTYCTSNSLEGGINNINYALDRLLMMLIEITIASYIFGSFDPDVKKLTVILEIIIVIIPIRLRKFIYKLFYKLFVKLKIISRNTLEKEEKEYKKKINEQMNATHKQYVNYKRKSRRLSNPQSYSSNTNLRTMSPIQSTVPKVSISLNPDLLAPNQYHSLNSNMIFQKSTEIECTSPTIPNSEHEFNKVDEEMEDQTSRSFYNLIHSKNRHIYRKALLTWNIDTLISWKGCLTVFCTRIVKNIIGVGFMAYLNYYRYSVNSDNETTNNNLLVDIFTHLTFLIVLLGQDIIYIIPASSTLFNIKVRKIVMIFLLIFEFCLVIGMRIIITNNYIPMAFIIIAYSNFTVHPDPRYTWDDENVQRKNFFDLFKPEINLRSEISYRHFGKTKGYISRNSSKIFSNSQRRRSSSEKNIPTRKSTFEKRKSSSSNNLSEASSRFNSSFIFSRSKSNVNDDKHIINIRGELIGEYKNDPETKLVNVFNSIRKEMQYKRNTRARYNSLAIFLSVILMVITSITIGITMVNDNHKEFSNNVNFIKQKPAICQWRADGISINEFSALAYACYYNTMDNIEHSWLYSRPKSSNNNFIIGEKNITSTSGVHYVDFINEEKKVIVVAIRGTTTVEDIFQDVYIWSASGFLQLSGYFGTFIHFWPRDTIASLVNFIVKQFTNLQLLYWVDVEKHCKELKETKTDYTIYLTGHSLGGGVAGVISAHLDIPAITFSTPGLGYSYKTYNIELKNLIHNFVNIIPMSDPITLLDSQVGQVQYIECSSNQPLSCHRIMKTIDALSEMCGEEIVYRYWDEKAEKVIDGEPVTYEGLYP